ncbi:MFS transporter [Allostreptomyces psammosilenae]|uniref:MFS family permease n=1 Tax=Allostreptomyces psammosilenae TaxID=1892865 RepID=A0A852ZMG6_9ACTN|nr:MFS transporter [Allostreptomyces psammosilenae]NYI03603.1 MFS family permease [Allostreptomyces psammosilenae]
MGAARSPGPRNRGGGDGRDRRDRRLLLGAFLLFLCSSVGQTFFVSLFAHDIRAEHRLSHGGYAGLYLVATLAGALALAGSGHLVDRHPARRVVLLTVPALALGTAAMALSRHPLPLLVALFLLRFLGQGMLTHTAFTLLGRRFTRSRGRAVSLATLGLSVGEALFPVAAVALAATVGWRGVWWLAAALLLAAGASTAALFTAERRPAPTPAPTPAPGEPGEPGAPGRPGETNRAAQPGDPTPSRTRAEALRDPSFYRVLLATAAPALVSNTVFFHQAHLAQSRNWSLTATASAFTVYAVATVLCNLVGGRLLDRLSALALLPYFLLPSGAGLLLLGTVDAQWGLFAFMALHGVSNGLSLSLFGATWPELYGVHHLGAIRSVVVTALVFASAAGPGLSGLLLDRGVGHPTHLVALAVYCFAASALTARLPHRPSPSPGRRHRGDVAARSG